MSEAAQILVIILSSALAIFLVLSIVLVVKLIKLTNQINKTARSLQHTSETIEEMVASFSHLASPLAVIKLVRNLYLKFKGKEIEEDE
ncbi:hypothetical protein FWD07_01365 [Candidatus Saccharibacteria bacterium]|nr:hypothetical protein [Candidatus Saccharibacteria bacterium]